MPKFTDRYLLGARPSVRDIQAGMRALGLKTSRQAIMPSNPRKALRVAKLRKTRPLKRKIKTGIVKMDGPVSMSYSKIPLYVSKFQPKKSSLKELGDQTFLSNSSLRVTYTAGAQDYKTNGLYFGYQDLADIMTEAGVLSTSGATYKNYKPFLKSLSAKNLITNQTNDVIHMTIYDVVCRNDIETANYNSPEDSWYTGAVEVANGSGTFVPGSVPFTSKAFCTLWKVTQVTKVMLNSGGHHVHNVFMSPNSLVPNSTLLSAVSGSCYKNLTGGSLIVVHGFPINDNAQTTVTTAKGAIDIVTTKVYKWAIAQNSASKFVMNNGLSTVPAQQNIVSDLEGSATTVNTV